jgi:single-strand DNA-binding protein
MLNRCEFIGHLGADPETRRMQSGKPVVNMRLAVSDTWRDRETGERKEKPSGFRSQCFPRAFARWPKTTCAKDRKSTFQVLGKRENGTDQSGADRYSTELVMQGFDAKLVMLDGKPSGDSGGSSYDERGGGGSALDDDLPFAAEWRL